jgi:hypothetical protein
MSQVNVETRRHMTLEINRLRESIIEMVESLLKDIRLDDTLSTEHITGKMYSGS